VSDERANGALYEPPSIEDRTEIALPLIAGPAGGSTASASFRSVPVSSYEPPRIEQRTDISLPLIGATSGQCAAFSARFEND
jgi:hypothetical protein